MEIDLSLIDTHDLMSAVSSRFDAHVFIAVKDLSVDGTCDMHFETAGMFPTCFGLANLAVKYVTADDS